MRSLVEADERNHSDFNIPVSYFVHIQTHGHLTEDSNDNYISHIHDLRIVPGSPLNCGMLNASTVGVEIEEIFRFERSGVDQARQVLGKFVATGYRPQFLKRIAASAHPEDALARLFVEETT